MVVRRNADPICVQHVWNSIAYLTSQKQGSDGNKMVKFLQKTYTYTVTQAELYIKLALKDCLITSVSHKAGKSGALDLNDTYKIPSGEEPVLDGKDWYCFECHLAGDVILCKKCFRVYHHDCINNGRKTFDHYKKNISWQGDVNNKPDNRIIVEDASINLTSEGETSNDGGNSNIGSTTSRGRRRNVNISQSSESYDDTLCSICNVSKIDTDNPLSKTEINYLLKFVLHRIRAWLPANIAHTMAPEDKPDWLAETELTWRANQLFFEHSDMSVIEVNLNSDSYVSFSEFMADVLTVQHNVAIFHGIESQEYGASELMIRDCLHDLGELRICADCYRHSNEKINSKWFCLPCRQPHDLVWAKQKGYPYWPAKVIRETSTHFDVRFFGGKYERSVLIKSLVKPINVDKDVLQIKPTAAFNKAYEELQYHQKLLDDPNEVETLRAAAKQKRSLSKQRGSLMMGRKSSSSNNSNLNISSESHGSQSTRSRSTKRKHSSPTEHASPSKRTPQLNLTQMPSTSDDNSILENIIDISDGDDDDDDGEEYSYRQTFPMSSMETDATYEQVSSSTENYKQIDSSVVDGGMQQLDHPYSDSVEKMRRKLLGISEKKEIIKCAMECMQAEVDKITNDHNEYLKRLFESHNAQISETKKKQWCYNCEQDAIYHCCWNTAYCSQTCQQQHWQAEHKKVCRRKR